jgi:ABC-type uncharacterized transport system permease subunit
MIVSGFEKTADLSIYARLASVAFALMSTFIFGAAVFLFCGVDPFSAYLAMFDGAFGSGYAFSETVVKATPLIFTGLAVALASTMLLWNIGCEGQLVMGGIFAAGIALFGSAYLPKWSVLPMAVLSAAAGGALWATIPGLLKGMLQVNEILTTLLLNYVAIIFMEHLYYGPWRDPAGYGFPGTALIPEPFRLARFFGSRLHTGLLIALILSAVSYLAVAHTKWGFRVRVGGASTEAAKYAGMRISRHTVLLMIFSGAIAGLAGMSEVCGIHHRLQTGLAAGYGYDGIIVAFAARKNPLAVPVSALFLGSVMVGADQLQSTLGLPSTIGMVLEGALLFGLLAGEAIVRYRPSILFSKGRPK